MRARRSEDADRRSRPRSLGDVAQYRWRTSCPVAGDMTAPPPRKPTHALLAGLGALRPWIVPAVFIVIALSMLRTCASLRDALLPTREASVTHSVVVQQVEAVAKLVSSEVTLRDVVTYEDTWMGSTKRSVVL